MRFENIIEAVYFKPWSITPAGWDSVHSIVKPHIDGKPMHDIRAEEDVDFFGNPIEKMEVTPQGVAIIPVKGVLLQHASLLDKACGACSYDDIIANLRSAMEMMPRVHSCLLNMATPGGMCVGNQEACDFIMQCREEGMKVYAFTDSQMCSAGYNLAASCDGIYITSTAFTGSIGTIMAIIDRSKQFEEMGLKVELFASGKFKGAGTAGTSLNDEQREYINGLKDHFAGMFKDNVMENRPDVPFTAMEGQAFIGTQALDNLLVDEIVADVEEALELIGN